jgi:NAD(P)-dependent dehydrogenase (short-subunit alcohol dehydrogenase family)
MTGLLLEGRRAVITGAANGIGRETAKVCAREGARVGVLDVNEEGAQRTASEVEMAGGEALTLVADLCDEGQVKAAVSRCAESWGGLDTVIGCAGVQLAGEDNRADRLELIDDDPATRAGRPAEVAEVIAFLASDRARYTTGGVWAADGGMTAI